MNLNRKVQPDVSVVESIDFIAPKRISITENVNLFHMKEVSNETVRLDLYFDAGKCRGVKGLPSFVNGLLLSGTDKKTSTEINDEINGLGGFYDSGISVENSSITIYCLSEHLVEIYNTLIDAIENVSFSEKEVSQFLSERKQKFLISNQKVSYLAQRNFQENLFHSSESYASTMNIQDFEDVTIEELKKFHKEYYLNGLTKIVLVGNVEEIDINQIVSSAGKFAKKESLKFESNINNKPGKVKIEKKDALQSAIRIGRILFNKKDNDYLDFLIVNTILGDYFGSRLMSNIREDKGYTYGIGSMVSELNDTGYFMIFTEVGKDVREATLKEIQFEIEKLQSELIPVYELELVQNYMRGQLLKSADGPYAMMDLFMSAEIHGKGLDFYNDALHSINQITPKRINQLANKYLQWDKMTIVTAG